MNPFLSRLSTGCIPARATVLRAVRRPPLSGVALVAALGVTLCAPAHAYVGPGAGLGVIGTLFGIGAAIVLAMFGLLWYPLKRAFGKKAAVDGAPASGAPRDATTDGVPTTRTGMPATDVERDDAPTSGK